MMTAKAFNIAGDWNNTKFYREKLRNFETHITGT